VEESPAERLLRQARRLVEQAWCRGADARDIDGVAVEPWDEGAASWSLLGAIVATLEHEAAERGELPLEDLAVALYALAEVVESDSLAAWNDEPERTQESVRAVLVRAEAACDRARYEVSVSAN
jgi:hypothetical protein